MTGWFRNHLVILQCYPELGWVSENVEEGNHMTEILKENLLCQRLAGGKGWRKIFSCIKPFGLRGCLLNAWMTHRIASISSGVPDRIRRAASLCPEVSSKASQGRQMIGIQGSVRWAGGYSQFAFLPATAAWRRGRLIAQDVGVLSIKVVRETLRMKGSQLWEYGEERTEG